MKKISAFTASMLGFVLTAGCAMQPGESGASATDSNEDSGSKADGEPPRERAPILLPIPTISSLSASAANPGDTIVITGKNFGGSQGAGYVHFADDGVNWGEPGNQATFQLLAWSDTSISFIVPVQDALGWHTVGGTTATVSVTDNGGWTSSAQNLTIGVTPLITGINTSTAPPGATIVVTGQHFGKVQSTGYVHFTDDGVNWGEPGNAAAFQLLSWADTQVSFVMPVRDSNGWQETPGTTVALVNSAGLTTPTELSVLVTSGVQWPVTVDSGQTNIGGTGDGHMDTVVTINSACALTATTHTWDTDPLGFLTGFHGGAVVRLFDFNGNVLDTIPLGPYGVEGGQTRTDTVTQQLSSTTCDELFSVAAGNFYDPQYSAAGSIWAWVDANGTTILSWAQTIAGIAGGGGGSSTP